MSEPAVPMSTGPSAGESMAAVKSTVTSGAASPPRTVDASEVGYLMPPRLTYPALSRRLGEEGRVTLRVLVDASGQPGQIVVGTTSGYPRLDDAALQAARAARFRPYVVDGIGQPVWVLIPFVFRLDAG